MMKQLGVLIDTSNETIRMRGQPAQIQAEVICNHFCWPLVEFKDYHFSKYQV